MKTLLFAVFALVSTSLFAQKKVADVAKFNTENFNYGNIKQGVPAKATFIITNTGNQPLIIEHAAPSCGCTLGDYTKEPIMPGKTGSITAIFNAAELGAIDKTVTVKFAGVDELKYLKLSGQVLDAAAHGKLQAAAGKNAKKG